MKERSRQGTLRRVWGWLALVAIGLWAFPVGYRLGRASLLACLACLLILGCILLRRQRTSLLAAVVSSLSLLVFLLLPGRSHDAGSLRQRYVSGLQAYAGTRYVWGGENRLGIDCSGLVRRGLINACVKTGLSTWNPRLVRAGVVLWWNDCTARDLRDGFRGLTTPVLRADCINDLSPDQLLPGDLAVTMDGVHVLAYLGGSAWIEADPGEERVLVGGVPSEIVWFRRPVQIVRWSLLEMKSRKTVADRVAEFGCMARARLAPAFARICVSYPPRGITLVGLKAERTLQVWVSGEVDGGWRHLKDYPILGASGTLGPKLRQGDGQVPEGLYRIESLNPNSLYHLALRVGYPSREDRERGAEDGRTNLGSDIMIHGNTCSIGCLAMGDEAAEDLFVLAAETGVESISVILSPVDFRVRDLPGDMPQVPGWMPRRYESIRGALGKLVNPS